MYAQISVLMLDQLRCLTAVHALAASAPLAARRVALAAATFACALLLTSASTLCLYDPSVSLEPAVLVTGHCVGVSNYTFFCIRARGDASDHTVSVRNVISP